ncbi:hypothetical protein MKK88_06770 [Methylobacterium sp. E-005]|uniref:hypothetical protein n=1 Tax=Methylobacterium sp. E-005 TaxID=2836549 RepID=UPI001FB9B73D|nr:hypothetical protein [Methylobacterium sp. E-005]MCJ2085699.1 hypothetical protein [Methylobacterium sp. E-005]
MDQVCPRNREVQSIADGVAADVRASGNYLDEQDFGNKVHARMVENINSMNDPDLEAEISCYSTAGQEIFYATKGSWRPDTLEHSRPATVCVYDHQTGRAFLRARRAADFADVVQKRFRRVQRIIVIQLLAGQSRLNVKLVLYTVLWLRVIRYSRHYDSDSC